MAKPPTKVVHIEWWDAVTPDRGGWVECEDLTKWKRGSLCKSTGFLIEKNALVVVVAGSYTMDHLEESADHFSGTFVIPRSMIKSIRVLK